MNRRSFVANPDTVLLVDHDRRRLARLQALLVAEGYPVLATTSFAEATRALTDPHVGLLVAAVKLGAYNGLQLALRGRTYRPEMPVVVVNEQRDAYFEIEANRSGAQFVALSDGEPELVRRLHDASAYAPNAGRSASMLHTTWMGGFRTEAEDAPALERTPTDRWGNLLN